MPFVFIDHSYPKVADPDLWQYAGLPRLAEIQRLGKKNPADAWFEQALADRHAHQGFPAQARLRESLTAADVMSSPVVAVNDGDTIQDALALMVQHDFRHLPVLSKSDALIGIVSEHDILKRMGATLPNLSWGDFYKTPIVNAMISTVLTVTDDTDVRELAYIMSFKGIGSLPVIRQQSLDASPRLVGIITKTDLYVLLIGAIVVDERV